MRRKINVQYVTRSSFKQEEVEQILQSTTVNTPDGERIIAGDAFTFEFGGVPTDEPLERDLEAMVRHKVRSAYRQVLAPCIVEHAGIILQDYVSKNYPGGLSQPMWDALGAEGFAKSVAWAGSQVVARAVIGYCNGLRILTFVGETRGCLCGEPRGARDFYWDTIFCPEGGDGLTYSEIASGPDGLAEKVKLSQSTKAMGKFLQYLLRDNTSMFPYMP